MGNIAIIPARGGSKRIPKKNIKSFFGKPIIAYSILAAISSGLFDEVMVSTDDEEIELVAKEYGAMVPFMRSKKNADDYATTTDVLVEVIEQYKSLGHSFEHGCCIYPTAPFVTENTLNESYQLLVKEGYDSVFPVLPFTYPIQRALKISNDKRVKMFNPEYLDSRSQDLEHAYHDCGQFYWFKTNVVVESRRLWTNNSGAIILSELEAHDIDNLEDWKIAEFKFKNRFLDQA